jgi:hypothetical protein
MPYLGNDPGAITDAFTDTFTGDASETNFTLTRASTTNSVFVRIHGVMQRNGTDFTVDGTTLTFTTAPPNASNNIVVQFFTVGSIQTVADNAITLAKMAHGTDGNLITYDAAGAPAAVATGSSGQVLTSAGAGSPPTFAALSGLGKTLQIVYAETTAASTGTTVMVNDDTIPQKTEGIEAITLAITPVSSTSRLVITGTVHFTNTAAGQRMWALFKDDGANAIWAGAKYDGDGTQLMGQIHFTEISANTTERTYKVRGGNAASGTNTFNGVSGARKYGAIPKTNLVITEIEVG